MTDAEKEMVERLREPNGRDEHALGYHPLINPDGPEAAEMIEQLSVAAEKERAAIRAFIKQRADDYVDAAKASSGLSAWGNAASTLYSIADAIQRGDHLENTNG